MAFEECGGLVKADGLCHVCLAPEFYLDAGAVDEAKIGGALSLPLIVRNAALIARPLFITRVWVRTNESERRAIDLPWERLEPRATGSVSAQTGILEHSGIYRIEVTMAAASRYRWREESFLFVTGLDITVDDNQVSTINQTINTGGGGTGETVYAPFKLDMEQSDKLRSSAPKIMELQRAERLELQMGVRGYQNRFRIHRDARFVWCGFDTADAMPDGPVVTSDGSLSIGRAETKEEGGPGDVRVMAHTSTGEIDQELSQSISRRHLTILTQNERLLLRSESDNGVCINEAKLKRGDLSEVEDGDVIQLLPGHKTAASILVNIEAHHGVADQVTMTRIRSA